MAKIINLVDKLFGIKRSKTTKEKLREALSSLDNANKVLFEIIYEWVRKELVPSLKERVSKEEKVKRSGCIEEHFSFLGKNYVAINPDPHSNYLPIPSNHYHDIDYPLERTLVSLAYKLAYK